MAKKRRPSQAEPGLFAAADAEEVAAAADRSAGIAGPTRATRGPLELGAQAAATIPLRPVTISAGAHRQLPYSKQFTPAQIPSLGAFLKVVEAHARKKEEVRRGVFEMLSPGQADASGPKWTMAYNALLSARDYCLVTIAMDNLTDFGRAVVAVPTDSERLQLLAQHILQNLNGIELVVVVNQLARAGMRLNKEPLAEYLARGGLGSNPDGTDINGVRGWLEAVGVFKSKGWFEVDEHAYELLAGVPLRAVKEASALDPVGLAILEQLALCADYESSTGEMLDLLERRPDLHFAPTSFAKNHLQPLQAAGFIEIEKTTSGRGGHKHLLKGTATFASAAVQRLLDRIRRVGFNVSGPELQVPFAELVPRLRNANLSTTERGKALELFVLRLLLRMGLRNIRPPERPHGNEEIDGYAEAFQPVHTRWQVQCKNTSSFNVDFAAREVGVAVRNRSTAILMVTTGTFSKDADAFVDDVIRYSPYTIVRISGADVDRLARDETTIFEVLDREARKAKSLRESAAAAPPEFRFDPAKEAPQAGS